MRKRVRTPGGEEVFLPVRRDGRRTRIRFRATGGGGDSGEIGRGGFGRRSEGRVRRTGTGVTGLSQRGREGRRRTERDEQVEERLRNLCGAQGFCPFPGSMTPPSEHGEGAMKAEMRPLGNSPPRSRGSLSHVAAQRCSISGSHTGGSSSSSSPRPSAPSSPSLPDASAAPSKYPASHRHAAAHVCGGNDRGARVRWTSVRRRNASRVKSFSGGSSEDDVGGTAAAAVGVSGRGRDGSAAPSRKRVRKASPVVSEEAAAKIESASGSRPAPAPESGSSLRVPDRGVAAAVDEAGAASGRWRFRLKQMVWRMRRSIPIRCGRCASWACARE